MASLEFGSLVESELEAIDVGLVSEVRTFRAGPRRASDMNTVLTNIESTKSQYWVSRKRMRHDALKNLWGGSLNLLNNGEFTDGSDEWTEVGAVTINNGLVNCVFIGTLASATQEVTEDIVAGRRYRIRVDITSVTIGVATVRVLTSDDTLLASATYSAANPIAGFDVIAHATKPGLKAQIIAVASPSSFVSTSIKLTRI